MYGKISNIPEISLTESELKTKKQINLIFQILRAHEGNEGQVCLYVIQLLFLKSNEFRNRVQEFVRDNSPDHWRQNNW